MKKKSSKPKEDLRPEYDFAALPNRVQGKYFKKYQAHLKRLQELTGVEISAGESANGGRRKSGTGPKTKTPKVRKPATRKTG